MTTPDIVAVVAILFGLAALVAAWLTHSGDPIDHLADEHADWLGLDGYFHGERE